MYAASSNHVNAAIFLIESGAKLVNSGGTEILQYGDLNTYKKLVSYIEACQEITLELQKKIKTAFR
jgi:hypothetical protein